MKENKKDKTYEEYQKVFKNKKYAENYHKNFTSKGGIGLLNPINFFGVNVARAEINTVKNLLSLCEGNRILDAPCGSGKLLPKLLDMNFSVTGADYSDGMLSQIKIKNKNLKLIQADIRKLPFKDKSFDVVICNRFLHRIPIEQHTETLKELYRVSKKYAIIYFGVKGILTDLVIFAERVLKLGDRGKLYYISKKEIKRLLYENRWEFIKGKKAIPLISTGYVVLARKLD